MGFREWVFLVNNTKDIRKVINIVIKNNQSPEEDYEEEFCGGTLCVSGLICVKNTQYPTYYYLAVCGSGGESGVWNFIDGRYPSKKIIGPWDKLPHYGTNNCELLWRYENKKNDYIKSPFDNETIAIPDFYSIERKKKSKSTREDKKFALIDEFLKHIKPL